MTRLTAINPQTATGHTKEMLDAVQQKMKMVPNLMRTLANAPVALESYLSFSGTLAKGKLSAKLRERIAILTAQSNSCGYCLSAHSAIGKMVGLGAGEITAARHGHAEDAKDDAALALAQAILDTRGGVTNEQIAAAKHAGLDEGDITEIVANVALNVFTNYFNRVADTHIDFPVVELQETASASR